MNREGAHCAASSMSGSQTGASPATRLVPAGPITAAGSRRCSAEWLSPASRELLRAAVVNTRLLARCGVCGGLGSGGVPGWLLK